VQGAVADERRSLLMRTHSGLHVLCGVVFRDFGALVTGGNMEPAEARMDFNLPEVPSDFKVRLEELVNAEITADRAIDVRVMPRDDALALPDIIRTQSNLIPADEQEIRIVDVATAQDLESQPAVPGDVPNHPISKRIYPSGPPAGTATVAPAPGVPVITITTRPPPQTTSTSSAPVYLDANTLVVVYDCCTGLSHLVAFDLRTGKRTAFATLYGPPVNIVRVGSGRLLVVTAANLLVVATRGHAEQLATRISAATG